MGQTKGEIETEVLSLETRLREVRDQIRVLSEKARAQPRIRIGKSKKAEAKRQDRLDRLVKARVERDQIIRALKRARHRLTDHVKGEMSKGG